VKGLQGKLDSVQAQIKTIDCTIALGGCAPEEGPTRTQRTNGATGAPGRRRGASPYPGWLFGAYAVGNAIS
jgi:hypothetical protein